MTTQASIRVCIDGTPLLLRSAGVKTYLYHWLRGLQNGGSRHHLAIFPKMAGLFDLDHENSVRPRISTVFRLAGVGVLNLNRHWPPTLRKKMDLFHASGVLRSFPRKAKLTATIHDLTTWIMPEMHNRRNIAADRAFANRILKHADRLITGSEHSRQDAVRVLGLPYDKIEVIHHGVPDSYFSVGPEQVALAARKYRLQRPYILFCSTIEPRKNLDTLLDAYSSLEPELRRQFDLVVVGMMGWASDATAQRLRQGSDGVRYLGYVPEADLPGITAGATAFVYPSLYEGFGFPLAQAMASGVPTVTSCVSAMPEIAGDGALLVDPRSTAELRSAIARILSSASLREELAVRARRQAQQFRWGRSAARSWDFFENALGS